MVQIEVLHQPNQPMGVGHHHLLLIGLLHNASGGEAGHDLAQLVAGQPQTLSQIHLTHRHLQACAHPVTIKPTEGVQRVRHP